MIHKWKQILRNWINCYFNEDDTKHKHVEIDSLLTIISHLHENLNLDESKSSILEAHSIEEFIEEKYPHFKFENGTVEPTSDVEVHIAASLLLFFVCVNSKDLDLKNAMCSRLSMEDQETIMKYSTNLMALSQVTFRDVELAITEACGQDTSKVAASRPHSVAETPPALRSLHGEVRRLQAALDAERFDRNYLQEELARNNLKLEKLVKDKEQYKLDILNLKAKISLCCGQDAQAVGADAVSEGSSRLTRQLEDLEERLVATQEKLDDALGERDAYKAMVDELKKERDKWLSFSQEETSRAIQLADELETERSQVHSLKELVSELRLHHQNNRLDGSHIECDDSDMSVHSMQNVSVCSEACAIVVEVQLGEERAKILVLKQQIQTLQDQLNELAYKAETEKLNLEGVISEKDNDIFNLKHRINEEIEEKNNLQAHYSNEFNKLNNEINELEQKLKDTNESTAAIIEQKMEEVKTLQEEKLSLLQSLNDETTKLEEIIKNLRTDLDTEKNLKLKMKEDYENLMMKINEKVLNRNNELVELQDKVFEKGEENEKLSFDLKKQKEWYNELCNKHQHEIAKLSEEKTAVEVNLQKKTDEAKELQRRLLQNVKLFEEFNKDIDDLKLSNADLNETCKALEESKESLLYEYRERQTQYDKCQKELENIRTLLNDENENYCRHLDEKNAMITNLQMQLQGEINYKTTLQIELSEQQQTITKMSEEIKILNSELTEIKKEVHEKDRMIYAVDLYLKEEKHTNKQLKQDNDSKTEEVDKLTEEIAAKENEIKLVQEKLSQDNKLLEEELCKRDAIIENANEKLTAEMNEIDSLREMLTSLKDEKEVLDKVFTLKCDEMFQLKADYEKMSEVSDKNIQRINELEKQLEAEHAKYLKLELDFDTHTSNLMVKLDETKKALEKTTMQMNNVVELKDLEIQTLQHEKEKLHTDANNIREEMVSIGNQKEELFIKLNEELAFKNKIEKEYLSQCAALNDIENKLADEIAMKNKEVINLKSEISSLTETVKRQTGDIKDLQENLLEEKRKGKDIESNKDIELKACQIQAEELKSLNSALEIEMKKEIDILIQTTDKLQKEKEEGNINHEMLVKEKDIIIEGLQEQLKSTTMRLESLGKDYEDVTLKWEKFKGEMKEKIDAKDQEIAVLKEHASNLKNNLEQDILSVKQEKEDLLKQLDEVVCKSNESDMLKNEQIISLIAEVNKNEVSLAETARDNVNLKESLENEKLAREVLETEKDNLKTTQEQLKSELDNMKSDNDKLNKEIDEMLINIQDIEEVLDSEKVAKESIIKEKDNLNEQLIMQTTEKDALLEEKDCLAQQLIDEKTVREMLEQEKKVLNAMKTTLEQNLKDEVQIRGESEQERVFLNQEKSDLIEEINVLNQQMMEEITAKDFLYEEKVRLTHLLEEERVAKGEIYNEKECLIDENEGLKHNVIEMQAVLDALNNEKEILNVEKEALVKSLSEEKSARDEMETEKSSISAKLRELECKYNYEIGEKQIEIQNINSEINNLKADLKKYEDVNTHLESVLSTGVDKLLHNIKKEKISNEVLQKLIAVDKTERFSVNRNCDLLINIAETLTTELSMRRNLEKALEHENGALNEMRCMFKQKEMQVLDLQTEVKKLEQVIQGGKGELAKQLEAHTLSQDFSIREVQKLQLDNQSLTNQLNDVKVQLEVKVHSLKEKLIDNENLTDKLKKTYECQIDNLNIMVTKLTSYLKDKTMEIEVMRKEKERLQNNIDENHKVIKQLEEEVKLQKQNQEKLISDFESERLVLKNMVTVTESVMEDQKMSLNKIINDHVKTNEALQEEIKILQDMLETEKKNTDAQLQNKDAAFEVMYKELTDIKTEKDEAQQYAEDRIEKLSMDIVEINKDVKIKEDTIKTLEITKEELTRDIQQLKNELNAREDKVNELKNKNDNIEFELRSEIDTLATTIKMEKEKNENISCSLPEKLQGKHELHDKIKVLAEVVIDMMRQQYTLYEEKSALVMKLDSEQRNLHAERDAIEQKAKNESEKLNSDNLDLVNIIAENKTVINNLEQLIQHELEQNQKLREEAANEKQALEKKCVSLQENQAETESQLQASNKEIGLLKEDVDTAKASIHLMVKKFEEQIETLKSKLINCEQELIDKDVTMTKMIKEKEDMVNAINDELLLERATREKYHSELATKTATIYDLKQQIEDVKSEMVALEGMKKENNDMIRAIGQRETFALCQEKSSSYKLSALTERELRDRHQVSTPTSDLTHSSLDSLKTITDLEKILHDKNRTITTLQSDITYLKSLLGESENKLLDIMKELEMSKDNCEQLSDQLKKLVNQKNEEIIDLKKQVSKMSVTENRASQIIKVSAKYQAIILKRIQEIKSNTILKELTNFGNGNCDTELRRGLNTGSVTMEDLENFLETTDRHLKKCSDKQVALQKERDRLVEVNRINESEILNMKKFLTELSISFKTLNSLKDMYSQKLSRVVSIQRTVRREILNLEGLVSDSAMCKLERGYAAVIQDLAECAMNLERWLERCISRTISTEKIKQAFTSESDRNSLAPTTFQNASLEVQLGELETSFQRLMEETARARRGGGSEPVTEPRQVSSTVMEVRAEYEDKLNRMKAKMKQLYQEQIAVFKDKQREEVAALERELQKARDKMADSSRAYEEHIRSLTAELWSVGEKFLMKKDEAEWLRKKQHSGSLMSLQHVHSSGLMPMPEIPSRPSDTHSLRSLPVTNSHRDKRDGRDRDLQMSDEEGEVFDNRWLRELASTPRREQAPQRLSELRWRNSLCPPHLKSSYPAETQFAVGNLDEEDLKYSNVPTPAASAKPQRKEVGITAYKKPGPPTPSKQAGRLSATGSELRESLRAEPDGHPSRKTSTPSRIRALFSRSNRTEPTVEGTPRSRRLSNIFRKK